MIYRLFLAFVLLIAAPVWSLSDWIPVTQQCSTVNNTILVMRCESAGLVSKQLYSGNITISVDVLAQSVGTVPQYWSGLALNSNVVNDDSYAQVALTQAIEPFNALTTPHAITLSTTDKSNCCIVLESIDPTLWHTLTLHYSNGKATYSVDNASQVVNVRLAKLYQVELVCVAVNPGTHIDGALAQCQFRNLHIATN